MKLEFSLRIFEKNFKCPISWKFGKWDPRILCGRTDGGMDRQTDRQTRRSFEFLWML